MTRLWHFLKYWLEDPVSSLVSVMLSRAEKRALAALDKEQDAP